MDLWVEVDQGKISPIREFRLYERRCNVIVKAVDASRPFPEPKIAFIEKKSKVPTHLGLPGIAVVSLDNCNARKGPIGLAMEGVENGQKKKTRLSNIQASKVQQKSFDISKCEDLFVKFCSPLKTYFSNLAIEVILSLLSITKKENIFTFTYLG